jgi:hypothetical protein
MIYIWFYVCEVDGDYMGNCTLIPPPHTTASIQTPIQFIYQSKTAKNVHDEIDGTANYMYADIANTATPPYYSHKIIPKLTAKLYLIPPMYLAKDMKNLITNSDVSRHCGELILEYVDNVVDINRVKEFEKIHEIPTIITSVYISSVPEIYMLNIAPQVDLLPNRVYRVEIIPKDDTDGDTEQFNLSYPFWTSPSDIKINKMKFNIPYVSF